MNRPKREGRSPKGWRQFDFLLAIAGLVAAAVGVWLTIGLSTGGTSVPVVGVLRSLLPVSSNLTSGISIWSDGTVVFADGVHLEALELSGETWTVFTTPDGSEISDVAATPDGPLYFSTSDGQVRRYFGGNVTTVLARPTTDTPRGVAIAPDGTLYVADIGKNVVFAESPAGHTTVVGSFDMPDDMASAPDGSVYVSDSDGRIWQVAGAPHLTEVFDVRNARRPAQRALPGYLYFGFAPDGSLLVSDELADAVYRVRHGKSIVVIGGKISDAASAAGVPAHAATIVSPWAVAVTGDYRLIFSESGALYEVQMTA